MLVPLQSTLIILVLWVFAAVCFFLSQCSGEYNDFWQPSNPTPPQCSPSCRRQQREYCECDKICTKCKKYKHPEVEKEQVKPSTT